MVVTESIFLRWNYRTIFLKADKKERPLAKIVPKNYEGKENCFLISGCKVIEGTGIMLILAVGKNSQFGKLKMIAHNEEIAKNYTFSCCAI